MRGPALLINANCAPPYSECIETWSLIHTGFLAIFLALRSFQNEAMRKKIAKKPVWIKDHVSIHSEYGGAQFGVNEKRRTSHIEAGAQIFKRNGITTRGRKPRFSRCTIPPHIVSRPGWKILAYVELVKDGSWLKKGQLHLNQNIRSPFRRNLVYECIGDTAMMRVAEAALQIRGDAGEHQVTREVKQALASGFGGSYWTDLFLLSKTTD